ncbi:MAG: 3-oxoacyl-ACP reductase FabG [Deltaproteobacteria bacterium]|nr:3-oxoacyl-ACP reductase FabG [Deltaproteobacteria bacterium]
MRLKNKVAVITGGAQGIGRAIAVGMAREGAKVVVADLQSEKAGSVADEVKILGGDALGFEVNVADESSVKRLAEATFAEFGRVDILVNDAGVYLKSSVVDMSEADWDRTLDINLGGNFLCCRAFVPAMREQKSGRIIKSLARELGPDGITVNAICPGSANTAMPRGHRSEEEVMQRLHSTPLPHVLEPEDIAGPILFLASDAAAYITGQSYNINCGTYMY